MIATDTPEKLEIENKFIETKQLESLKVVKGTQRKLTNTTTTNKNLIYFSHCRGCCLYVKKTDMKCLLSANSRIGNTKRQQSFGVKFDDIDIH